MTRKKKKQNFKRFGDSTASVNGGKNCTYNITTGKYAKTKKKNLTTR